MPPEAGESPEQAQEVSLYPLVLTPAFFATRQALVVGGGKVAERRVKALVAAGAKVQVVAPALTEELQRLAQTGRLEWLSREWQPGDIAAARTALLVFAATNQPEVNQAVAREARRENRLVNIADDPAGCDFVLPGVIHKEGITLAVTTYNPDQKGKAERSEAAPALTAYLRRQLEQFIGPEYGKLARLLYNLRPAVKARVTANVRPALWRQMVESGVLDLLKENREGEAQKLLENLLEQVATQPYDED